MDLNECQNSLNFTNMIDIKMLIKTEVVNLKHHTYPSCCGGDFRASCCTYYKFCCPCFIHKHCRTHTRQRSLPRFDLIGWRWVDTKRIRFFTGSKVIHLIIPDYTSFSSKHFRTKPTIKQPTARYEGFNIR